MQTAAGEVWNSRAAATSGQGGIRTHDTVAGMPVFETGAFNHSATCPGTDSQRNAESIQTLKISLAAGRSQRSELSGTGTCTSTSCRLPAVGWRRDLNLNPAARSIPPLHEEFTQQFDALSLKNATLHFGTVVELRVAQEVDY